MKLATALSERADLQKRISELETRLNHNAKVQEGEKPAEDPVELLKELDSCLVRLEELIAHINKTNNETKDGKQTISDLIAHRDCLKIGETTIDDDGGYDLSPNSEVLNAAGVTSCAVDSVVHLHDVHSRELRRGIYKLANDVYAAVLCA